MYALICVDCASIGVDSGRLMLIMHVHCEAELAVYYTCKINAN